MPALEIPLFSPPSKAPDLPNGWGNISFSHCFDGLLVGWSPNKIGVDIERADRLFNAEKITNRYFSKQENNSLSNLNQEELRSAVLEKWVIKEAAIKWQRGSLAVNLSQWKFCKSSNLAVHESLGYKTGMYRLQYKFWYIAIAYDEKLHKEMPIICIN